MSISKKYYWIKLKTNFFNREDIDFLLSQKNGAEYVVLYQMLCLNTANNDGRLETKMGEIIIPYNAEKIVRDCKHFDIDTVNVAMSLYKRLGLIYEEEQEGVLKISNYEDMVGSETSYAEKMRKYRNSKKQLGYNVANNVEDIVRQENRDIDIRDKDDRDKNIENNNLSTLSDKSNKKELLTKYEKEFDKLWEYYPNKKGKDQARTKYISVRKSGTTYEEVAQGLKNYLKYIKAEKIEDKYIKHGSTWFNQKCWNDDYKTSNTSNKKSDGQMELLKGVYDGTIKIS